MPHTHNERTKRLQELIDYANKTGTKEVDIALVRMILGSHFTTRTLREHVTDANRILQEQRGIIKD